MAISAAYGATVRSVSRLQATSGHANTGSPAMWAMSPRVRVGRPSAATATPTLTMPTSAGGTARVSRGSR